MTERIARLKDTIGTIAAMVIIALIGMGVVSMIIGPMLYLYLLLRPSTPLEWYALSSACVISLIVSCRCIAKVIDFLP